jgi:hypothetical protein
MASTGLVIAAFAHLIPAATVPNGDIERAMSEPLAEGRDEVLYLICTHPRIKVFGPLSEERTVDVIQAVSAGIGEMGWNRTHWAQLTLPDHVKLSKVPWSILDPALESVEGLKPIGFDPRRDFDGWDGRHRQELLGWIFDRHLENSPEKPEAGERGAVRGGFLDFKLEYVGRSKSDALRRAAGPHHKLPLVLNQTLVFAPELLVYVLPCEPRVVVYDPEDKSSGSIKARQFQQGIEEYGLDREVISAAAEEMLIAWLGAPYNKSSTQQRRFPWSSSAKALRAASFTEAGISLVGLPQEMQVQGIQATARADMKIQKWELF